MRLVFLNISFKFNVFNRYLKLQIQKVMRVEGIC